MKELPCQVRIGPPQASPDGLPHPLVEYAALWDTGATGSVVSKRIVADLALKPVGTSLVHGVHGKETVCTYFVSIVLPNDIVIEAVRVTEAEGLDGFDVLIGMDVIGQGDFAVSNYLGKTTFAFRMPSLGTITF